MVFLVFRNTFAFASPHCVGDVNTTPLPMLMTFAKYFGACSCDYPLAMAMHFRGGGWWGGTDSINLVIRMSVLCSWLCQCEALAA